MLATVAGASLILQEGFDTTTSGWESRPTGDFSFFTNSISYGNPAGSIFGDFGSQGVPLPRLDAFRADGGASGGQYATDYSAIVNFIGWEFSFFSTNDAPTTLTFGFDAGANGYFSYPVTMQVTQAQTWVSVNVPGSYSVAWTGGDGAAFSNALTTVQFIEVQVSDANTGGQRYYVDGISVAIPEPGSLVMTGLGLLWGAFWLCHRKHPS